MTTQKSERPIFRRPFFLGSIALAAILVVAGLVLLKPGLFADTQLLEQARSKADTAQAKLNQLQSGYLDRLNLISELTKQGAFDTKSAEEIDLVSRALQNAELKTQIDFDQFDQFQNKLSNKVAEYFVQSRKDPKDSAPTNSSGFFRKFEALEREIERTRVEYTQLALDLNKQIKTHSQLSDNLSELPVFRATAQAIEMNQAQEPSSQQ
jgi:hypothetical protein